MPKIKIKKSVRKRFKITKTGKVMFEGQHQGHLRRRKNQRTKRRQAEPKQLHGEFAKKIKKMLAHA